MQWPRDKTWYLFAALWVTNERDYTILTLLNDYDLLATLNKKIMQPDENALNILIKSAFDRGNQSYASNSNATLPFFRSIDIFGIHKLARSLRAEDRTTRAHEKESPFYLQLKAILEDNTKGRGLKFHKYAVVSEFLDIKVTTDSEAELLICAMYLSLNKKIKHLSKEKKEELTTSKPQ